MKKKIILLLLTSVFYFAMSNITVFADELETKTDAAETDGSTFPSLTDPPNDTYNLQDKLKAQNIDSSVIDAINLYTTNMDTNNQVTNTIVVDDLNYEFRQGLHSQSDRSKYLLKDLNNDGVNELLFVDGSESSLPSYIGFKYYDATVNSVKTYFEQLSYNETYNPVTDAKDIWANNSGLFVLKRLRVQSIPDTSTPELEDKTDVIFYSSDTYNVLSGVKETNSSDSETKTGFRLWLENIYDQSTQDNIWNHDESWEEPITDRTGIDNDNLTTIYYDIEFYFHTVTYIDADSGTQTDYLEIVPCLVKYYGDDQNTLENKTYVDYTVISSLLDSSEDWRESVTDTYKYNNLYFLLNIYLNSALENQISNCNAVYTLDQINVDYSKVNIERDMSTSRIIENEFIDTIDPTPDFSEPEPTPTPDSDPEPEPTPTPSQPEIHDPDLPSDIKNNETGSDSSNLQQETKQVRKIVAFNNSDIYLLDPYDILTDDVTFFAEKLDETDDEYKSLMIDISSEIGKYFNITLYDFNLFNPDGSNIHQLSKEVTVILPYPFDIEDSYTIKVYRLDNDNNLIPVRATIDGQTIAFYSDHFSIYIFAKQVDDGQYTTRVDSNEKLNNSPKMGDTNNAPYIIIMIIGLLCILKGRNTKKVF